MENSTSCILCISVSVLLAERVLADCKAPLVRQGMSYSRARVMVIKSGFFAPSLNGYGYSPMCRAA